MLDLPLTVAACPPADEAPPPAAAAATESIATAAAGASRAAPTPVTGARGWIFLVEVCATRAVNRPPVFAVAAKNMIFPAWVFRLPAWPPYM